MLEHTSAVTILCVRREGAARSIEGSMGTTPTVMRISGGIRGRGFGCHAKSSLEFHLFYSIDDRCSRFGAVCHEYYVGAGLPE